MVEHRRPVVSRVPGDLGWRVNLDRHDLGYPVALDEYNETTDSATVSAAIISALDVCEDKRVANVVAFDLSCRDY